LILDEPDNTTRVVSLDPAPVAGGRPSGERVEGGPELT
jgi:hypothetical protein